MDIKERVIDIRQFFLYIFENLIVFIIVGLAFALGMTGFSYKKQKNEIAASLDNSGNLTEVRKQNHDAFYGMNNVTKFTDADQPGNTFNSSARVFVDFDYTTVEGKDNLDFNQMTTKLQQDAMLLLVSDSVLNSVISNLNLQSYDDMKNITVEDLKWMINKNFYGVNVFQIYVTDVDGERAYLIEKELVNEFINSASSFKTINSVEIIDSASKPLAVEKSNVSSQQISKKKLLKYFIVGCVGGVVFVLVIFFLLFVLLDTVRNSLDVAFAEVKLFGNVARNKKKKSESIKRIAYNISLINDLKVLTIVPADKKSEDDSLIKDIENELNELGKKVYVSEKTEESLKKTLNDIENLRNKNDLVLLYVNNIKEYAESTLASVNSDAVIINSTFGKTRMKDLIFAKNEINKTGTRLAGTIIDNARYV